MKHRKPALLLALLIAVVGAMFFGLRGSPGPAAGDDSEAAAGDASALAPKRSPWKDRSGVPTEAAGRVRSAADDSAIEGALVVLRPIRKDAADDADSLVATTDAGGAWAFDEIPSGDYQLSATADGFRPETLGKVHLAAKGKNTGIDVALEAGGNHLHGIVSDVTGGPVEGALVRIGGVQGIANLRERNSYVVATRDDGSYSARSGNGRHRISVWHPDYAPTSEIVEVKDGDRKTDFGLVPMGTIEGTVLSEVDGKPVAGARVSYMRERMVNMGMGRMPMPEQSGSVVADDRGNFRIRGLNSGAIQLGARASGFGMKDPITVPLSLAERATGIKVYVTPAHDVFGRVVFAGDDELGVAGAEVGLMSGMRSDYGTTADDEGYFELHGLFPGNYGVMVSHADALPVFPPHAIEVGDEDLQEVRIEVDRSPTIRGRVEPPTLAEVEFKITKGSLGMGAGLGAMIMAQSGGTSTNPDTGEFELGAGKPGSITLEARSEDGRAGQVTIEVGTDGADDVVIRLEERGRVSGTVTDSRRRPVAGALVNLRAAPEGGVSMTVIVNGKDMTASSAPTGEDGSYEISGLEPGSYEVSITGARADTLAFAGDDSAPSLEIAESESKTGVDFVVEASDGVIRGVVVTHEGHAAPDTWVTATKNMAPPTPKPDDDRTSMHREAVVMVGGSGMGSGPRIPPVLTDEEGRFEFAALSAGHYEIAVEGDGGGSRASRDNVEPDADLRLALAPLGRVEGSVMANGDGVSDYSLRISGPSPRTTRIREPDGKFELDRLDPGTYELEVTTADGTGRATVKVVSGETAHADIRLDRLATVTGTVVDESGKPVAGARVVIGNVDPDGGVRVEISGDDPVNGTEDDGSFEVSCAEGNRLLLIMGAEGMMPIAQQKFVAKSGEAVDLGKIQTQDMSSMMGGMATAEVEN